MDIGKRIKQFRKRKGMTQEQLASALNISFQSVSKWETGITLPDLSMVPGLTRLLEVSADELLGLTGSAAAKRQEYLYQRYLDSLSRPYDPEDLETARQAVAEHPENPHYLYWLAGSEYFDGFERGLNAGDEAFYRKSLEHALQHSLAVFDTAGEEKLRTKALYLTIQTLVCLGRRDEAKEYASQYPSGPSTSRDDILELCAEGEEKQVLQQKGIKSCTLELLQRLLNYWRSKDLHEESVRAAITAAERIVQGVIPDGNLLEFHNILFHICAARAVLAGYDGKEEELFLELREAKKHAAAFGSLFGSGVHPYTAPLFRGCTADLQPLVPQFVTPEEEFKQLLEKSTFDPYRSSEQFIAIAETLEAHL